MTDRKRVPLEPGYRFGDAAGYYPQQAINAAPEHQCRFTRQMPSDAMLRCCCGALASPSDTEVQR